MEIAKAGWLYRQSSILHRWKKHWFVLYRNGDLSYFDSPDSFQPEDKLVVQAVCLAIKFGRGCTFSPPDDRTKDSLLCLTLRDGELRLCAENPDDMKAWHIALEEARVINRNAGSVGQMTQTTMYTAPGVATMYNTPGTQVVYANNAPGTQVMYTNTIHNAYPGYVMTSPGTYVVPNAASPSSAIVVGNAPGQVVEYRRHGYNRCYRGGFGYGPMLWW